MPLSDDDFIGIVSGGENADLVRATIMRDGLRAERELEPTRQAALRAWDAWRMHDVFKVKDARTGEVKTVFQPNHPAKVNTGVQYVPGRDDRGNMIMVEELRTNLAGNDETYPELIQLRQTAEDLDRKVLDLQDAVNIMRALNPLTLNRARR